MAIDFDFDDVQYTLRDMARDLFGKESPITRVRELWDGKPYDRSVWTTMANAGLTGLTVPESFGGAGCNEIDLVLVYEEAGRAALPEPLLETTGVAAPLIAACGDDALASTWLPRIATGEAIVAVQAPGEPLVAWGAEADLVLLIDRDGYKAVERADLEATPVAALDPARPLATITTDAPGTMVQRARDPFLRGAFGAAAILNGISQALLDRSVAYTKDREQFGRPVGSFQAVKHKLASMHQSIATSRPAAWYAGYALANGLDEARAAVSVAKAAAAETEAFCNTESLQCHGGIGFTWEDDLHLWLKKGMTLRSAWGTARQHRRHLVETVMNDGRRA